MTKIKITNITPTADGGHDVRALMYVPIPLGLMAVPNKIEILEYYKNFYKIIEVVENNLVFLFEKGFTPSEGTTAIFTALETDYADKIATLNTFTPNAVSPICGYSLVGNTWSYIPPSTP